MSAALEGLRILVTRPAHQAAPLCARLEAAGATCLQLPVLEITPVCATDPLYQPLKQRFIDLDLYHKVIFVSANAADLGADWIDRYWPQLPVGVQWFAIGRATARRLVEHGLSAQYADTGMDSEALLSTAAMQQVSGEKILICRGAGGRELLRETLQARGAQVEYADLYRRTLPRYAAEDVESLIYNPTPSAILLNSAEALDNFTQLANRVTQPSSDGLLQVPIVVPSQRVAAHARTLGYRHLLCAENASDEAMVEALLTLPHSLKAEP